MARLKDLHWDERVYLIQPALAATLETLTYPASTSMVAERIMRALSLPSSDKNAVSQVLTSLARKNPHATHDGAPILSYGKEGKRWRWHKDPQDGSTPEPPEASPGPPLAQDEGDQVAYVLGWLEDRQAEARILGEEWEVTAIGRLKDKWLEMHP